MMMVGDPPRSNPTVQVPPWDFSEDHQTYTTVHSPFSGNTGTGTELPYESFAALRRYLPSNNGHDDDVVVDFDSDDLDIPVDAFSCDEFRMYDFKVRKCARARSHDWTECPFAHPGEKARRRDPRKYHYSGIACPDFRKGGCRKGDSCEFAHGVFECWLHPARYRTQPCKDGTHCRRRVCFFAHTPDQLRVLPQTESYDRVGCNSPSRLSLDAAKGSFGLSPTSVLYSPPSSPPSESPPMSPSGRLGLNSINSLGDSMRSLQIGTTRMSIGSPNWGLQMGSGYCSPRSPSTLRPVFMSLPSTPTRVPPPSRSGLGAFDLWEKSCQAEEPIMERVESGRDLRAKIYAKLSKENSLDSSGPASATATAPDFGWVSELVK